MLPKPPDAKSALSPLLDAGEDLIWYDQPDPKAVITSQWSSAVVGLVIFSFALAWAFMAVQEGAPFPVIGIGCGIAGVGLWLAAAPLRKPYEVKFIYYAITDRRLIIAELWRKKRVQSFYPENIRDVEILEGANGLSDVIFGKTVNMVKEEVGDGNTRLSKHIKFDGFFGIQDAARVAEAVEALKLKS